MTDIYSGIAMIQNGITPADSAVRTLVTKEVVPGEVYMGKRVFGKESQDVVIETGTYDSEQRLGNILKTILSKREKAKELRNIAFNSFYYDASHRIYIVSISPNATLKDVLTKCPFSLQEKGFLALDVCNEVKKIHDSFDVHNGLSLERVLVSDRDLIILTNYFNSIPPSVGGLLPEELVDLGKGASGFFPRTRYQRESVDVFETALMVYEMLTGKKPGFSKEYKLTDAEQRVLGQTLRTAPDSFGKCFAPFHAIGFNVRKAGDYFAVVPRLFSALAASAALCMNYLLEDVSKNKLKDYLAAALDKTKLEENFGAADCVKSSGGKSGKKYVFPFVTKNAGAWFTKNGGRYNYVPLAGNFFGFIKKPEERVHCPALDELIKRLGVFRKKRGPDYYGRIHDLMSGKKGKNILNEMTELHLRQRLEQVGRERMSRLRKAAIAVTTAALTIALLVAGYLQYASRALTAEQSAKAEAAAAGPSQKKDTVAAVAPAAPAPKSGRYIKREDARTYTVPQYRSARIDVRYLKFAVLDSLDASTHISPDTLPFFKVTSLDRKFIVDYPNKLLLSVKGQKLKPGPHPVKIEASNPECKPLATTIAIMVTQSQPSAPPVQAPVPPQVVQPAAPPQAIRPTASVLCGGVYKLEHIEKGDELDDVWHTEKEKFVDEGGTIYVYRQGAKEIITANPKPGTHLYFTKEYLLSKPMPVLVTNGDLISHDRGLLEKCLKSKK
ncbi:MAG TPA: serine/threonine-protein kinase [Chitinivibrionales bacterium]|nr:serine/threonine-protein kinase [Chitinivibrionales bacterium]